MQYHPSQQITTDQEALFSMAILQSLYHPRVMLGDLAESTSFHLAREEMTPATIPDLNFSQKLGHLYEDAFFHLLERTPRFQNIVKNIQIITADKRTLGELDFLLWDSATSRHIHLELAIKFYLVHQDAHGFHFPGPDARDNYHRKVSRLREHQLTLTQNPATQESILPFTAGAIPIVQHLVHGVFFDHIDATTKPTPEFANVQSRRRSWLYSSELAQHFPQLKTARVLPKQLWLCEMDQSLFNALVEVSVDELIELAQQRCTMFVRHWAESPMFLAPNSWPH